MNDAAIQGNLIKALSYRREASFKAVKWKEASFKAFKRGSEMSYSLSFTAFLSRLLVSSLSTGKTELSWQHSPLKRIKNDWRLNIEAFGWRSWANAAHLPPASSWKANAEGTFGWHYCECNNRLFLRYGAKVEWVFGARWRLDLNAITGFGGENLLPLTLELQWSVVCMHASLPQLWNAVNFTHYSPRRIEQL